MKNPILFFPSFDVLATRYDAFILDLWGVIHDGQQLYPGVKEALQSLQSKNKKVIFLSNAPRRARAVVDSLAAMGIDESFFDGVVTSGEVAYQALANPETATFKPAGHDYFYVGLEKDRGILEGLPFDEVKQPESAQFLLLAHSYKDNQPMQELRPLLAQCKKRKLPAVCINPDMEVVRQTGERVYCAGRLAEEYLMMNGEVVYFGKPHRAVYEACLKILGEMPKSRILAVGDNLATDIKGAKQMDLASAFVTGGVMRASLGTAVTPEYEAKCQKLFAAERISPDFVLPALGSAEAAKS